MIFFYCLLLYSIFSISFSQEEPIHDFLHLFRIRSLICGDLCLEKSTKNPGRHRKAVRRRTIQITNELSKHVIPLATHDTPLCNIRKAELHQLK